MIGDHPSAPVVSNPFGINAASLAEREEELKSLLMKVKEESEKKKWLNTQHSENEDNSIWSHH